MADATAINSVAAQTQQPAVHKHPLTNHRAPGGHDKEREITSAWGRKGAAGSTEAPVDRGQAGSEETGAPARAQVTAHEGVQSCCF